MLEINDSNEYIITNGNYYLISLSLKDIKPNNYELNQISLEISNTFYINNDNIINLTKDNKYSLNDISYELDDNKSNINYDYDTSKELNDSQLGGYNLRNKNKYESKDDKI